MIDGGNGGHWRIDDAVRLCTVEIGSVFWKQYSHQIQRGRPSADRVMTRSYNLSLEVQISVTFLENPAFPIGKP